MLDGASWPRSLASAVRFFAAAFDAFVALAFRCAGLTIEVSMRSVRWISVGEGVPLPRPRIQPVHGTVRQKCARNALPARSGFLYGPALGELRCRRLPPSSTSAPEVT